MSDPNSPDRFNEEKATYTLRGADQPDLEAGVAAIRAVVKTLPVRPGVYRMLDARGDVLYVGKARALKNRVNQYTQVARQTEAAAADGLADPLDADRHHQQRGRGAAARGAADQALPAALQRAAARRQKLPLHPAARGSRFPARPAPSRRAPAQGPILRPVRQRRLGRATRSTRCRSCSCCRSCTDSFFANRSRPCLLYQIRRCSAPCVGRIDEAGYAELVRDAKDFLGGRSTKIQQKLQALMTEASEAMDFELAAVYRDRLRALTFIQGSQAIHAEKLGDADLFALACKGGTMCIQAFFIRGGQNWGHRSFFPAHTDDVPEDEVLAELPRPVLRGGAAAAADPGRPRAARSRACSRRPCPSGPAAR